MGKFVVRRGKELRQDLSDDNDDNKFPWGEVLAWVGDKLLTVCPDARLRDNMLVLIVAFPALGLAFAPLLTTSLLESAASKRRVPIILPWLIVSPGC